MEREEARVFVGVDWATTAHQVCVLDRGGGVIGERSVPHDGAGLAALADWLTELAGGIPSAAWVSIEVPHGAVVESLLERGLTVHSINPKQLDRFRDRFTMAGAKDDRLDARVLADSLRTDPARFRVLRVDEPAVIELREWSRMADDLQQEHGRLCNRMREQLRRYYPQTFELTGDVGTEWFMKLWETVPTPEAARKVRTKTIEDNLRKHRIRRFTASKVLEILRRQPLVVAPGTTEAATAHIQLLIGRIRIVNSQLDACHRSLDTQCERLASKPTTETNEAEMCEQHDVTILRSWPGLGRIGVATLLAEASQPLRARDYQALRALSGLAPVTRQSGKRRGVVMRQACSNRLRRAMYHWARVATQHDDAAKAHYAALRARGHSHGRSLRGVADRLLGALFACLRAGAAYDPARRVKRAA